MPKIFNVIASVLTFILAMALVYGLWTPVTTWIGLIDDTILQGLCALAWFTIVFVSLFVAPILVLNGDNVLEKLGK